MIKNLLWKQALELAKKKFGNLNTNEANKWLMDKYNALLGKENTKNIANKIREDLKRDRPFDNWKPEVVEHDPFKNLRGNESFDELLELGGKKLKKFDPFKKEGKKIDFMDYYSKRKRGEFDDGGMILPQPKPYNFEEKIEFLKKIKNGVGPKTYLQLMSNTLNEGVENKAITKEERDNFLKRFTGTISEDWTSAIDDENLYMYEGDYERYPPKFNEGGLAGMLGEIQPVGLAQDREALIQELYNAACGFDGTGKTFSEFMADVMYEGDYIYAKGGRVGLKGGGMTPSEKWMRNYYFDGKGGYDQWMSFQEFQMGPGVELWNRHIGKYAKGGRAGYLKGGLLRVGIMEALDKLTRKGTRQGVDVRETILPADDVGDYAINMGDVRELFTNLDKTFAGKITSKESVDDIITRFRDKRKLDLSESIKEFLNNRIKQYKSGLENIKKYGQRGSIEEVGDHAEDLKYLIKATKEDIKLIDKYGLTQQSKKATKHAEGGRAGYLKGGILKAGEFVFTTIKDLYKGKKGLQAGRIEKDLMKKYKNEGMELGDAISKANREAYEIVDNRKLEIIEEAMKKVDTASDDYIKLVDEHIRIIEPEFYKDIKRWDSYRPDLADKTRALMHPDWAAARFGDNYDDVLLRNQNRALRQQSDEINKMYPDKSDTDILVDEIDEMNKVNIDELFTGRKKNSEGGIIGLKDGGTLLEKYKEYAPKGPWWRGLTDTEITIELYNALSPYMSLFMKEGGRVGFKEGKGMSRRAFLKLMGAAAALPVVGKFFKLAKPAAKVMDDIQIQIRGDADWEYIDDMWSGGTWANVYFKPITDKGRKILEKFTKGKDASLTKQDDLFVPGNSEEALVVAEKMLKSKPAFQVNVPTRQVYNHTTKSFDDVKGSVKGAYETTKNYSKNLKNLDKTKILKESDELLPQTIDFGGRSTKYFEDEYLDTMMDIVTKKAEGGRIGLDTGGPPIEPYSTSDPKAAAKEIARRYIDMTVEPAKVPIDKDIQLMFDLDRAKIGGTKDFLGGEIDFGINKGFGRDDLGYGFNWSKKFSDGGSVLQRPMFYQGGLTKTVPPKKGPMPQGLQSDVYDGIMRPGVINGRN